VFVPRGILTVKVQLASWGYNLWHLWLVYLRASFPNARFDIFQREHQETLFLAFCAWYSIIWIRQTVGRWGKKKWKDRKEISKCWIDLLLNRPTGVKIDVHWFPIIQTANNTYRKAVGCVYLRVCQCVSIYLIDRVKGTSQILWQVYKFLRMNMHIQKKTLTHQKYRRLKKTYKIYKHVYAKHMQICIQKVQKSRLQGD